MHNIIKKLFEKGYSRIGDFIKKMFSNRKSMSYEEVVEQLKSKNISPRNGEYYYYKEFPLEELFDGFFKFAQTFLEDPNISVEIRPARMYFTTNTNLNALAWNCKGYNLIEIFKGTIFILHQEYVEKEPLFEDLFLKPFKDAALLKESGASVFLFKFSSLYIIYHETGHLIQRSKTAFFDEEQLSGDLTAAQIKERHIREHDADWFAAQQIMFHLLDFSKEEGGNRNALILSNVISLSLAGIYMYFILQSTKNPVFYLADKSHPHPNVRVCYIIFYMFECLGGNLEGLNHQEILSNAILIAEKLLITDDRNIVQEYSLNLNEQLDQIEQYINKIRADTEEYPAAAINKLVPK
jgi:hypothetical protein